MLQHIFFLGIPSGSLPAIVATRSRAFPDPNLPPGGDAFEGVEVASSVGPDDVGSQVSQSLVCFLIVRVWQGASCRARGLMSCLAGIDRGRG
jgi:hypothetical protein